MEYTPTEQLSDHHPLFPIFAAATHEASALMCRWTRGLITLSLDEVREIPLEDAAAELGLGDEMLTMVVLSIVGEVGGEMILAFDEANGRQLASTLTGEDVHREGEWTELEQSALNETGNILNCAYLNALTRLTGEELVPTPPYFVQDYGASVLEQALMCQAVSCDRVLVGRTRFHREGKRLDWHVFFVPTPRLRELMEHSLLAK